MPSFALLDVPCVHAQHFGRRWKARVKEHLLRCIAPLAWMPDVSSQDRPCHVCAVRFLEERYSECFGPVLSSSCSQVMRI